MIFDLDQRTAALSVGEFAGFVLGPREAGDGGAAGLWRAQLGIRWHQELRSRTAAVEPAAEFEVAITGRIAHRGWTLTLTGRIDQLIRTGSALTLREIKTVTRSLPADEAELRAEHPDYFIQLACYGALARLGALTLSAPPVPGALRTELGEPGPEATTLNALPVLAPPAALLAARSLELIVAFQRFMHAHGRRSARGCFLTELRRPTLDPLYVETQSLGPIELTALLSSRADSGRRPLVAVTIGAGLTDAARAVLGIEDVLRLSLASPALIA